MKIRYYGVNTETHKKCSICQELKPRSEFYKDSNRKDGIDGYCKPCKLNKNKKWQDDNPDKWQHQLAERIWYRRQKQYGISKEEYLAILEKQDYKCDICKNQINTSAAVDHCHSTNKVRGILCRNCNTGIGLFNDNTDIMDSAILYLKKWG